MRYTGTLSVSVSGSVWQQVHPVLHPYTSLLQATRRCRYSRKRIANQNTWKSLWVKRECPCRASFCFPPTHFDSCSSLQESTGERMTFLANSYHVGRVFPNSLVIDPFSVQFVFLYNVECFIALYFTRFFT